MNLNRNFNDSGYRQNVFEIEKRFNKLAQFVFETKKFERYMFIAVLGLYVFIICHIIGFAIGRMF